MRLCFSNLRSKLFCAILAIPRPLATKEGQLGPEFQVHGVLILRQVERRIELLNKVALQLLRVIIWQNIENQVLLHPGAKFTLVIGTESHVSIVGVALVSGDKRIAEQTAQGEPQRGPAGVASDMALPDAVVQILLRDAGINHLLPPELLRDNLVAKCRQCLDVPDGHDVIAWSLRNLAAAVGQWIEFYEVVEIHHAKKSIKPSHSAANMPPIITA